MTAMINTWTVTMLFLFSCHSATKQTDAVTPGDTANPVANSQQKIAVDTPSGVFVAMLKPGLDQVHATINDSTMFIARKGQLFLYWNYPHTAFIADGRSGYISPEQIKRVDTPLFKFNFSKRELVYDKDYELCLSAQRTGADLNALIKRIQNKDSKALLQFFNLRTVVDGASAEAFPEIFWMLINMWTDKELSAFMMTLKGAEKKDFCSLLIESSYGDPYPYYQLYYPLTLAQIEAAK